MQKIKREYIKKGIILCFILALLVPSSISARTPVYIFVAERGMEGQSSISDSEQANNYFLSDDSFWSNETLQSVNSVVTLESATLFHNIKTIDRLMEGYYQSLNVDECWEANPYWDGRFSKFLDTLDVERKSQCTAAYYFKPRNKIGYTEDNYSVISGGAKYKILGYVRYEPATFALIQYIGD